MVKQCWFSQCQQGTSDIHNVKEKKSYFWVCEVKSLFLKYSLSSYFGHIFINHTVSPSKIINPP